MTAATHRRNRRATTRSHRAGTRASGAWAVRLRNPQTMQWGLRGVLARQYQAGTPVATYSYTDINNNLRVAQDAAGLTTSTYDGDNLRRKIVAGSSTTTFVWDGADYLQIRPSAGDPTLLIILEGEVVGHVKGSEKRDYIVDTLGSVVAYLNSSQTLTDLFEYWPYGELVAEIEEGTAPFLWVGGLGYFYDGLRYYVRARMYRQDFGSWNQLDPIWPIELPYTYPSAPISLSDPTGLMGLQAMFALSLEKHCVPVADRGGELIVLGAQSPLPLLFHILKPDFGRRNYTELHCPTREQLMTSLSQCDTFWFYGHGSWERGLHILDKGKPSRYLSTQDVEKVAKLRKRLGIPKMRYVYLGACYQSTMPENVNAWLRMAERVDAYEGLTFERGFNAGSWFPHANFPKTYTEPQIFRPTIKRPCPPPSKKFK